MASHQMVEHVSPSGSFIAPLIAHDGPPQQVAMVFALARKCSEVCSFHGRSPQANRYRVRSDYRSSDDAT